jgi:hypothetical protein
MNSQNKKYSPSNGTEYMWFCGNFCDQCLHHNPDPDQAPHCEILKDTICYSVNDPNYPSQWQYNEDGKAICTDFHKWNWDQDGNPHDPNNTAYVMPENPNQLKLF